MNFIVPILALSTLSMSAADYAPTIANLESVVQEEMTEWGLGGVAIALVDDQKTVYAKGFGEAQDDSMFRIGSLSKLFNAVAVMQQVEAGKLDLDAPIDPALLPINPFPGAPGITLRHILSHRSGLQRESTVGSYFDSDEPTIAEAVKSLRDGVLVTLPGEKTRYSNIAPTLAGRLVEMASGKDFVSYQNENVLAPLDMKRSTWLSKDLPEGGLVTSHMRVADGKGGWTRRVSPTFDLGTIPAGNLFASAGDVAKFASALIAGGGDLLKAESFAEMRKPQFTDNANGFGLGFVVGHVRDHKSLGHGGAVYGFSSSILVLPEAKLAVIVLVNEDIAGGRVARIRDAALFGMLEAKFGEKKPTPAEEFKPADLAAYAGDYESQSYWAKLWIEDGKLVGDVSGQPTKFTPTGKLTFLANSRINYNAGIHFATDASAFNMGSQEFHRVKAETTETNQALWENFLGSYGPDVIPLIIHQRYGHLYATTENMVDYRLTPLNRNVFKLPPGMYVNEQLVFLTDPDEKCSRINFCNMFFDRN